MDSKKKSFVITKQELESWRLIKQKKKKESIGCFIVTKIRRFKGPSQISWKWKTVAKRATGQF